MRRVVGGPEETVASPGEDGSARELALDGRVRPIRGVLPAVLAAKSQGWPTVVVPTANLAEASLVDGIEVLGVGTLKQLQNWLTSGRSLQGRIAAPSSLFEPVADLADVVGQSQARFAVEVAAAGAHHLMVTGPPGVGETMLAQRLPGLLPDLTESEALEVTAVHSVAGMLSDSVPLITRPPFIAPHHSSSVAALVGGGTGLARPGAVSRAHRGVLFLDECGNPAQRTRGAADAPWKTAKYGSPAGMASRGIPPAFSWCWRRTPARARRRFAGLHLFGHSEAPLPGEVVGSTARSSRPRVQMFVVRAGAFAPESGESSATVRERVAAARGGPLSVGALTVSTPTPRWRARPAPEFSP